MSKLKKSIEIEIQVQIENTSQLIDFLNKKGSFVGESHQTDSYYSPFHRDFMTGRPIKEWLRLRDSSGKYSINYKNWHYDKEGRSLYCDEFESSIESLKQLEKIFTALNMELVIKVEKKRKIWNYQNYEIALDNIKGLGNFVEIEYKGENTKKKPQQITAEMISFLKKLKVGAVSRNYVGYPFQLLFPKEVKWEKF